MPTTTYTNRLAHEKSPYLLRHTHNPVDWFPWGDEAFNKAKADSSAIIITYFKHQSEAAKIWSFK
jgi:uncharacterized protein YyaL (SSP411 family)